MAITSSCIVYNQPGGQGACRIYVMRPGARYLGLSSADIYRDLSGWGVDGKVRSIDVFPGQDGTGTTAILFGAGYINVWDDIQGQFVQVHRPMTSLGVPYDVATDLDSRLKDRYVSLLILNTDHRGRTENMLSLGGIAGQFAPQIISQINSQNVEGLSVRRGPRARWDWSHIGDAWLQPQRAYARIDISLTYDPSGFIGASLFSDYQIDMSFWLDLWVAGGVLNAASVKYQFQVSAGKLAELVATIADLSAQLTDVQLNTSVLPSMLAPVNAQMAALGRTPTDAFLLPGNQAPALTLLGNSIFVGNDWDDVTAVLETQP
jgi:hypothetical protein